MVFSVPRRRETQPWSSSKRVVQLVCPLYIVLNIQYAIGLPDKDLF